jgi:ribosomal-protein-alanine N-acetyltransferase
MIIQTERLVLRPFEEADAPSVMFYCDPEVMRFIPGGPRDPGQLLARFPATVANRRAQWASLGFGLWAVVFKATGEVIGHCGLQPLPDGTDVEVAYLLDKPRWGKGLATEAAVAAIRFGFETAGLEKIVAIAMPENRGSTRVMEKAGMRLVGPAHHYGIDVVEYKIARADANVSGGHRPAAVEPARMSKTLLISRRPEVIEVWQAEVPDAVPVSHVEALARLFAEAHANGTAFEAIYADFRDEDRSLIRSLFQTAGFNREQVAATVLHMDVDAGSFADQQIRFFSGLGMDCRIKSR